MIRTMLVAFIAIITSFSSNTLVSGKETDLLKSLCQCGSDKRYKTEVLEFACKHYCSKTKDNNSSVNYNNIEWPTISVPEGAVTGILEHRNPDFGRFQKEILRQGIESYRKGLEINRVYLEEYKIKSGIPNNIYIENIGQYKLGIQRYKKSMGIYKNLKIRNIKR